MSSGAGPVIRSGTRRHCVAEDHVQARHVCAPANSWVGWGNLSMCWPWQECPCTYLYHLGGLAWHTVVCSHWPELSGVPVGPWPAYGAGCIVSSEIKTSPIHYAYNKLCQAMHIPCASPCLQTLQHACTPCNYDSSYNYTFALHLLNTDYRASGDKVHWAQYNKSGCKISTSTNALMR